jgi:tripartite-type tricarboxylate transporter receptor subunit TctC
VLVINPGVPAQNLQELVALAKARPGQLNYATTGAGGSGHLANEMLGILAGIKTQHIPYKGAGPALVDLIGGQVQMFINNPLTVITHIRSGRVRGIAVTGETRLPALPQVPTFTEGGVPGMEVKPWFFVLAPAGTPRPIIDKLASELARIGATADFQDYLAKQGMNPYITSTDKLAAMMKAELTKWAKVIKTANIKLEN